MREIPVPRPFTPFPDPVAEPLPPKPKLGAPAKPDPWGPTLEKIKLLRGEWARIAEDDRVSSWQGRLKKKYKDFEFAVRKADVEGGSVLRLYARYNPPAPPAAPLPPVTPIEPPFLGG